MSPGALQSLLYAIWDSGLKPGPIRGLGLGDDWREDYKAVQGRMFFGESPGFEEMMAAAAECERFFNTGNS